MRLMHLQSLRLALATAATLGILELGVAQDAQKKPVKARKVVTGLDNPSGVAVSGGKIYVATHKGVMKVALKRGEKPTVTTAVGGYNTDIYGKGPKYNIGPLGVAFLDRQHIVVGDGSRPDGEEMVRVFKLSDEEQTEKDAVFTLGPITAGDASARGEGNFYGVAIGAGGIFVTCNGDDTKGWVSRAQLKGKKPGDLKPFIATKEAVGVDAPVAITFSPDGDLVIGQMGEMNVAGDSLLTIYDAKTGKLKKSYKTGLSDIAGLAYSPTTKKLYAVDFSWVAPEKGGLFELMVEGDEVKTKKIVSLDKPTAISFANQGMLYITEFGTAKEGSEEPAGALLRIGKGL